MTWLAAAASAILVAARTAVGPVLVRLPWRHGVHLGDLATVLAAMTAASLTTYSVGRRR